MRIEKPSLSLCAPVLHLNIAAACVCLCVLFGLCAVSALSLALGQKNLRSMFLFFAAPSNIFDMEQKRKRFCVSVYRIFAGVLCAPFVVNKIVTYYLIGHNSMQTERYYEQQQCAYAIDCHYAMGSSQRMHLNSEIGRTATRSAVRSKRQN